MFGSQRSSGAASTRGPDAIRVVGSADCAWGVAGTTVVATPPHATARTDRPAAMPRLALTRVDLAARVNVTMAVNPSMGRSSGDYATPGRRVAAKSSGIAFVLGLAGTLASAQDAGPSRHASLVGPLVSDAIAARILREADTSRGASVHVRAAVSAAGRGGGVDLAIATEHSIFDACIGARHPSDRRSFHVARESCREERGIATSVLRFRIEHP